MRTDEERLRAFCELVHEMLSRKAIKDATITAKWSIHFGEEVDEETSFDMDIGDVEHLRSLLVDIRRFVSPGDDVFFARIVNIVERAVSDAELRDANRQNREAWKQVLAGDLQMQVGGKTYSRKDCFDVVANSKLFHGDADKAAEFDGLPPMLQGFMLANVSALAIKGSYVLRAERNLIKQAFDRDVLRF